VRHFAGPHTYKEELVGNVKAGGSLQESQSLRDIQNPSGYCCGKPGAADPDLSRGY